MSVRRIRVLCVDDNELLAKAVQAQVSADPRMEWAGWVLDTRTLLDHVRLSDARIILMDIDMPGSDAFELVAQLAHHCPGTRVLMFSAYVRQEFIDKAVHAGAWGYVSKSEDMADVLDAIVRADAGEFVLSHETLAEQRIGP